MARRVRPFFICALAAAGVAVALPTSASAACTSSPLIATEVGVEGCYLVPSGVTSVTVVAVGAGGANGTFAGGGMGAKVTSRLTVAPGDTLYAQVGIGGGASDGSFGRGGGASDVRTCSVSAVCSPLGGGNDPRLVVAGGGGGGGIGGGAGGGGAAGFSSSPGSTCQAAVGAGGAGNPANLGGQPGSCVAGGAGGTGAGNGSAGGAGFGGAGGGIGPLGGGGGGGYWGGGGGAGRSAAEAGSGGGGGGGSSFGPAGSVFEAANGAAPSVRILPPSPFAVVSPTGTVTFALTQPQSTISAPRTLTITNQGDAPMSLTGLTFAGANPGDFLVTSNGCLGTVAVDASCTITVAFAPQGQGARSAQLAVAYNSALLSPTVVELSGTGGSLPTGPAGADGQTGPTGPAGAAGPTGTAGAVGATGLTGAAGIDGLAGAIGPAGAAGPAGATGANGADGAAQLVTCRTVTTKKRGKSRRSVRCSAKRVTKTVTFRNATARDVSVLRNGRRVADGYGVTRSSGRVEFVSDVRLAPGTYRLVVGKGRGARRMSVVVA